jgi:hypothetical protein
MSDTAEVKANKQAKFSSISFPYVSQRFILSCLYQHDSKTQTSTFLDFHSGFDEDLKFLQCYYVSLDPEAKETTILRYVVTYLQIVSAYRLRALEHIRRKRFYFKSLSETFTNFIEVKGNFYITLMLTN